MTPAQWLADKYLHCYEAIKTERKAAYSYITRGRCANAIDRKRPAEHLKRRRWRQENKAWLLVEHFQAIPWRFMHKGSLPCTKAAVALIGFWIIRTISHIVVSCVAIKDSVFSFFVSLHAHMTIRELVDNLAPKRCHCTITQTPRERTSCHSSFKQTDLTADNALIVSNALQLSRRSTAPGKVLSKEHVLHRDDRSR